MAKYIGKRLIYMAVTLFVVAALTFTLMKILPGSPFDEERFLRLEEAKQAEALARYGLDKPVPVQFARYIGNMLKGDFGISFYYTNIPVTQVIFSRLGPSVIIGTQAILIGLAIGLSLGIIAACRHNGIVMPAGCQPTVPCGIPSGRRCGLACPASRNAAALCISDRP